MVPRFGVATLTLAMICFASFVPTGRSFQLAVQQARLTHTSYTNWRGVSLRTQFVEGSRCQMHSGDRLQGGRGLALRASANADPDAGLSKAEKLKKYQQLAVELITKAGKLPPGASKTRYLQQARNAKAMADALGYSGAPAEPVSPKQAAMDAAMAYKAAQHDAETPAESKPRKRKVQCDIVNAEPEMAEELTTIVNWAYRGKAGQQGWTGEMDFIDGLRISLDDMRKTLEGNDAAVLVARNGDQIAGCIKIEQLDSGEAEVGMFAVDPDYQSSGIGSALLDAAHDFAQEVLEAKETVMMVLDNRQDILSWYQSRGYVLTQETAAFPKGLNVGVPKRELQFVRLKRPME